MLWSRQRKLPHASYTATLMEDLVGANIQIAAAWMQELAHKC